MITAHVASIPERKAMLQRVVADVLPQVDHMMAYLNCSAVWAEAEKEWGSLGFLPSCVEIAWPGDKGDAGKFWGADTGGIHVLLDDDLIYPPDYVDRIIEGVECYGVVSYHGRILTELPIDRYFRNAKIRNFRCLSDVAFDEQVHIPGSGVMAFDRAAVRFPLDWFETPDMADVWAGAWLASVAVPVYVLSHEEGWIQHQPIPEAWPNLYRHKLGDDSKHVEVINRTSWPDLSSS